MRFEEIAAVVRVAAEYGVTRIRLTGGEPLVRLDLPDLIRMIAEIPGIEDISLTTNGILLEKMAAELKQAGLKRINLSLDTLQPEKFSRITRGGKLETIWRGLEAAEKAGLMPIKINVVAMRGINDDELQDLARLSLEHAWHIRFIELMPVNNQKPWGPGFPAPADAYLSIPEIKAALEPLGLETVQNKDTNGPAQEYALAGAKGRLGFISPLSQHFCQQCNRMRMTADGSFRPCLLQDGEIPFLSALRAGQPVLPFLQQAIEGKPAGHELFENNLPSRRCMIQIGG
jgi:GTP 3',8-cyclase